MRFVLNLLSLSLSPLVSRPPVTLFSLLSSLFISHLPRLALSHLGNLGSIYSTEMIVALGLVYMLPGIVETLIQYVQTE